MSCYAPLTAFYSREIGASGKRGITFDRNMSFSGVPIRVPCGQCIGCRLERARQWAIRCVHERMLHEKNVFVTLTYSDEFMPLNYSLVRRDPQLFMKRLRKEFGDGIRFFGCGEYGDTTLRPHYHIVLFNCDFPDKRPHSVAKGGDKLYVSNVLSKLWPYGFSTIGAVNFDSCAYVARYVVKKVFGDGAASHYGNRLPEFCMMSRRPGIGSVWFDRFGNHAYEWDSVIINGREVRPPRFYDTRYELASPEAMASLKVKRRRVAMSHREDNTPERRRVREEVTRLTLVKKQEV